MSDNEVLFNVLWSSVSGGVDEVWGPLDPRVREKVPLELRAAHAAANMAVYFEAAEPGRGQALMRAFADDPPELCPRLPKIPPKKSGGWPPKIEEEGEEPIDPRALGASLVVVAELIANKELSGVTRELGQQMMG